MNENQTNQNDGKGRNKKFREDDNNLEEMWHDVVKDLLGHIGSVTSGLMIGIFRFLLAAAAAAAAELMASLSLTECGSASSANGLGGRCSPAVEEEEDATAAAAAANSEHPLDILRVAVGEGWSDVVGDVVVVMDGNGDDGAGGVSLLGVRWVPGFGNEVVRR